MAALNKPLVLNETVQAMVDNPPYMEALEGIKNNLGAIALAQTSSKIGAEMDMAYVAKLVRSGLAKNYFNIGDQITVPWKDPVDNQEFDFVWNVAHIPADGVEIQDGETKPGMILVANYAHRYGVMFSQAQAIQWFETGLAAGTYYLTFTQKYGTAVAADGKVNFTLTQDIPAGGQLAAYMKSDKAVSEWTFSSYASPDATTPIETVSVSAGQAGTLLGAFNDSNSYGLNAERADNGSNRYKDSAIRQWLNSAGGIGSWWAPAHNFDRPPAEAATKSGFLAGFGEDFLAAVNPIKIDIATSTLSDGGVTDTVYDKFFLPSLEEMHYVPQAAGVEGEVWDYYKQASLSDTPLPTGTAFAQMRHFGLENHATAQGVRLRSGWRAAANIPFYVYASGNASGGSYAIGAGRALAACCIC